MKRVSTETTATDTPVPGLAQAAGQTKTALHPSRNGVSVTRHDRLDPSSYAFRPAGYRPSPLRRGRGVLTNETGRFESEKRELVDDGWMNASRGDPLVNDPFAAPLKTEVTLEKARTIITRNQSPDLSFDRSINPYRGCEHGCTYCFARPTHTYHGMSAGLDFETKLFAKPDAPHLLEKELARPGYQPRVIALGTNTDPYQPIEREHKITRQILEVLSAHNHPVAIVTKSALIARDIDILGPMAEKGLAKAAISITTLDRKLSRAMEPRAATPERRLATMKALSDAGIPTVVMSSPMIPGLNDQELEAILAAAADHGATYASFILLRLPLEVRDLFIDWLRAAVPDRADRVMSLVRQMRDGKDYDSTFHKRARGSGPLATTLRQRFILACKRLDLNREIIDLRCDLFSVPSDQLSLFAD